MGGAFFFFNDTATTEIYTLSLHDALPISGWVATSTRSTRPQSSGAGARRSPSRRSEEHTSELQSQSNIVCRLLLEKKTNSIHTTCLIIVGVVFPEHLMHTAALPDQTPACS